MSNYTTRRRTLAGPDANPPSPPTSSTTAVPSRNTHPAAKTLDPKVPSSNPTKPHQLTSQFSRLNGLNRHGVQKPATKDIHMQPKSLTTSVDSDSKLNKSKSAQGATNSTKGEKFIKKGTILEKRWPKEPVGDKKMEAFCVAGKETEGKKEKGPEGSRVSVESIGGRRSLDGARVELSDVLANCGVRVISVDMPPFMQIHAVNFARKIHDSLEKFSSRTLALSLKKEFDGAYGPAWHCIVGTSFGSFVTYSVGGFLYFSMDQKLSILLFKTTVQRAD